MDITGLYPDTIGELIRKEDLNNCVNDGYQITFIYIDEWEASQYSSRTKLLIATVVEGSLLFASCLIVKSFIVSL